MLCVPTTDHSFPVIPSTAVRKILALLLALVGAVSAAVFILGRMFSAPRYEGPRSDHFDGERFHNLDRREQSRGAFLKWMLTRERTPWPDWVDDDPGPRPPDRVGPGELRVTFVNHATTLIQFDGINLLTDPIWSERTSPVSWAGPRRHRPAGIRIEDLPRLDAIVVSHNHYDHLDLPTLRRLAGDELPIVLPLGNDLLLAREKIPGAIAMDWWESRPLGERSRLHVVPAQHFSARGGADRDANLWGGFVIENGEDSIYFAGDTGWGLHFPLIAERFPQVRLAILPIGAFKPRWFMAPVHIDPAEAIRAHHALGARASMVMHFGTFPLGDDGMSESADLLRSLLDEVPEGERPSIWIPREGEGKAFP